jgi:hypothetical protein
MLPTDSLLPSFDRLRDSLIGMVRSNPLISTKVDDDLHRLVMSSCSPSPLPSPTSVPMQLKGFRYKSSRAWRELSLRFGTDLTASELLSVAEVVAFNLSLTVDRKAKRKKSLLVKWFDDNLKDVIPFLNHVRLIDNQGKPICNAVA